MRRKDEGEDSALIRAALYLDADAVSARNLLHDRQAQPCTLTGGVVRVAETLKNMLDFLRRDADTLVGNGDDRLRCAAESAVLPV